MRRLPGGLPTVMAHVPRPNTVRNPRADVRILLLALLLRLWLFTLLLSGSL